MPRPSMDPLADFKYTDVWHTLPDGTNSPWTRILADDIQKHQQEKAANYSCYATVQRFANSKRIKGEQCLSPLYFDLDCAEDPAIAQVDSVKIIDFFTSELDIQPTDIHVYFSGSKGFHILINHVAFNIQPRNDLTKVFKHISGYLTHRLEMATIDPIVYTMPRMLRIPNSVHQTTRLFKIEISIEELKTLSLDGIKVLAKTPRLQPIIAEDVRETAQGTRKAAAHFYQDKLVEYQQMLATAGARYSKDVYKFNKENPPICVKDILENGWKKDGDRNPATLQLACYMKDAGYTKAEALALLEPWVLKYTTASGNYQKQARVANTRSALDSVYNAECRFGCAFIRSLHGPKVPGNSEYDRVACSGIHCSCTKAGIEQDEAEATVMHLDGTANADYTGKLVKTRVMIAGRKQTPYIVPRRIEFHCYGRSTCKKVHCPLFDVPEVYHDLGQNNRELIQMAGAHDNDLKTIIKGMSGTPSCTKYKYEVLETTNVEELLVIPMAETGVSGDLNADGRYVLRKIYSVGGMQISENKYYELTGYVFPHPKNQEGTIVIKSAKPLQDIVESFKLTPEIGESLKFFQPADETAAGIEVKLAQICADLTYNVTRIVERDETLLGVLLVQHSILRFSVPWSTDPIRGWVELKIVGDTATGKSEMVSHILKYTGLGTRVNAESASRTGLTYRMEQGSGQGAWYIVWGAWPLSDGEMIWIDEDTGITKEQYGEMTLARSDGRLEVKRAVTAETPCRVRAILSGNVASSGSVKRLSSYGHGVESLKDIFNNEDIRRFDFGIFMRAADVDPDKYNQELPIYPQSISSELLKNNVLFAWSRTPTQVQFAPGAIKTILDVSNELSKTYGRANDTPLVSPSDQRNKMCRLSTALAALLHSVDETGEIVVVKSVHAEFLLGYLKGIYNAPGCGLNYFAKLAIKETEIDDEKYAKITNGLKKVDTIKSDGKFFEFVKLFAQQRYLRLGDVEAMLSIDKEEAKAIVAALTKLRMIENTSGGFRKTSKFNGYIAKCFELGLFDNIDDDEDD